MSKERVYACPNCKETGCYDDRTTTHLKICPMVGIQCPKCSLTIFQCEKATHPDTCSHEPVPCKYFEIGCHEKPLRRNLSRHEQDTQLHLAKVTEKVLQLTKMLQWIPLFRASELRSPRYCSRLPGHGSQATSGLYKSSLWFTVTSLFRTAATSWDPNVTNCIHITAGSDVYGCGHGQIWPQQSAWS